MNAEQAIDEMRSRIEDVSIRVYMLGESVEGPCVVLTPPALKFNGPNPWPTDATFGIALVVPRDDRTVVNLLRMVGTVCRALDESNEEFALTGVEPGTFPNGGNSLPAYLIEIEVALNDSQSS